MTTMVSAIATQILMTIEFVAQQLLLLLRPDSTQKLPVEVNGRIELEPKSYQLSLWTY